MKLEVGKRYVLRNGVITGPLEYDNGTNYPWSALVNGIKRQWCETGTTFFCLTGSGDIVAEYSEPDPSHDVQQPLRWVENTKPDKPGIWLVLLNDGSIVAETWYSDDKEAGGYGAKRRSATFTTRCYLGPIPEILPPVKKVVERLWIREWSRSENNHAEYREAWFVDGETIQPPGYWIRTDRTREVEQ